MDRVPTGATRPASHEGAGTLSSSLAEPRHIVLVGMMGSGKSRIGRKLAKALGRRFVDTDSEIERRQGRTVREIFDRDGEDAFRQIEAEVLADVLASEGPSVIATGGGAALRAANRSLMRQHGLVIWLRATPAAIAERMSEKGAAKRPLLAGTAGDPEALLDRLTDLCAQRDVGYHQVAHDVVNVDELPVAEIVDRLARLVAAVGETGVG
ncbi:MAG: shikimate kinase [Acidimicrobiales bacterium]|nr:shikimate kinase [Acidimicrobiales bacterium]